MDGVWVFCVYASHLDSYSLEKAGVSERKLHHLFDLGQLLPTASDVIVADVIKALLLVLSQGNEFILSHGCGIHLVAPLLVPVKSHEITQTG